MSTSARPFSQSSRESFVANVNSNGLQSDAVVRRVCGALCAATAAVTAKYLTRKQAPERDAELFATPAVDDKIYCGLERQQQNGE